MNKYTRDDLKYMQAWPLGKKIGATQARIMEWYREHDGQVYVSFSGGKDSTVLLHIARRLFPDIPAVFCDTGLEYPEIRSFVKTFENVVWLKPDTHFSEVVQECGWNFPSKEVAKIIYYARRGSQWALNNLDGLNSAGEPTSYKQRYKRWKYLLNAPVKLSNKCCLIMKERPLQQFERMYKSTPIIGTMASESAQRKTSWLRTGCNAFNSKRQVSKPMSFWMEQDVLEYLRRFDVPYAVDVYGDIIDAPKGLTLTGEQRTGCMFCPVGCHLDKENRFMRMKKTHPKHYQYCINKLGLGELLDYVGVKY